jgi:hypothetical protein
MHGSERGDESERTTQGDRRTEANLAVLVQAHHGKGDERDRPEPDFQKAMEVQPIRSEMIELILLARVVMTGMSGGECGQEGERRGGNAGES